MWQTLLKYCQIIYYVAIQQSTDPLTYVGQSSRRGYSCNLQRIANCHDHKARDMWTRIETPICK